MCKHCLVTNANFKKITTKKLTLDNSLNNPFYSGEEYKIQFCQKRPCDGNGNVAKQKISLGEQWLCRCVIILGTFLYRPRQNNNVKWPNSAVSREREPRRLIFYFYFKCFALSEIQFRDGLDLRNKGKWLQSISRDSEVKYKIIF